MSATISQVQDFLKDHDGGYEVIIEVEGDHVILVVVNGYDIGSEPSFCLTCGETCPVYIE